MLLTSSRMPQSAACDDFVEELPLGHFGVVKLGVAADVFDGDGDFEEVLHLADALGGVADGFPRVGQREEVMRVAAVDAAPAEVVGKPRSFGAAGEFFEALEVFGVERLRRAEVHGDAVLDDAVLLENLVEHFERTAAVDHVVFGDDFEPVDDRLLGEDVVVVRNAQADADTVIGKCVEAIGRHERGFSVAFSLSP